MAKGIITMQVLNIVSSLRSTLCVVGMTLGIVTNFFNKRPLNQVDSIYLHLPPFSTLSLSELLSEKGVFTMLTLSAIWNSVTLSMKLFPTHTLSPFHH
jgi:hypothetical protein